jgi:hypothetical protein
MSSNSTLRLKADKTIASYRRLRTQPLWQLLASDNGPIVISLLQTHLYENDRTLPSSIFHERIGRDLEELRTQGEDFPQTARAYISSWLLNGYLERRFPSGALEEVYELSTPTIEVIRFISNLEQPYSAATESRLALVIDALERLAQDTDSDKLRRIDRLQAEKDRIDQEIEAIHKGQMRILPQAVALERIREILLLANELAGDFRKVRDQFDKLNRELRERILDNEGNRGGVLDSLFAGIDLISESDAGRTFSAFWRLLTDPVQAYTLEQALTNIMSREFIAELSSKERRFLLRLTRILLEQGGMVHEVLQNFARSLKHFVQSREYLEHRRINQIIKEAMSSALALKNEVNIIETLKYSLELTSSRLRSLSQWALYNPLMQALPTQMIEGDTSSINLEFISQCVAQSEIDFRSLKSNICTILEMHSQVSIAEVLQLFPASQGLGTIVGLLALASRHGFKSEGFELVEWQGRDEQSRRAKIPKIFFLRERANELV